MSIRDLPWIPSPGERGKEEGEGRGEGEEEACIYVYIEEFLPFK
jgi:hypothetical protein